MGQIQVHTVCYHDSLFVVTYMQNCAYSIDLVCVYVHIPHVIFLCIHIRVFMQAWLGLMVVFSFSSQSFSGTVYTFGFGSDHDSNLLEAVSRQGSGVYYFIDSTEKVKPLKVPVHL